MNFLKNLSFREKLILLVTPPIVSTLYFAFSILNLELKEKAIVDEISPLVMLSTQASAIVHELQKERGASTGFVGSKGEKFGNILSEQRELTDKVVNRETKSIQLLSEQLKTNNPALSNQISQILTQINQRESHRQKVDSLSLSGGETAKYYTDTNAALLSLSGKISNLSTFGDLTTNLRNYYNFLQAKESAGQERAILNIALSSDAFPKGIYRKFVSLESAQNAYLKSFEQFANEQQINELKNINNSTSALRVNEIRNVAHNKYIEGNFGIAGEEWFNAATDRINQLKALEDNIANQINDVVKLHADQTNKAIFISSLVIVFVLILTLILGFIIIKQLISQASRLAKSIYLVSTNKDLSVRTNVQSKDELGRSAKSFNNMLEVIAKMLNKIESSSEALSESASNNKTSVEASSKNLERQKHETTQAASATEEMSATVNEISNNVIQMSEAATEANNLSQSGLAEMEKNTSSMETLNQKMSHANTQVVNLRDSSKDISGIVDVIKAIAEQTNLLALNAAIEAARAGEQGRGFAVVSDEVRSLAQKTQSSTQQIEQIVSQFQSEANSISDSIETCFAHVQESSTQAVSVKDKLSEINGSIDSIANMCKQIATASEEQVSATNEIAANLRAIDDLASESVAQGQQILDATEKQSELTFSQRDLVAQFKL